MPCGSTRSPSEADRHGARARTSKRFLRQSRNIVSNAVSYALRQDKSRTTDKFRPTHLMEKVSCYLEQQSEPVSRNIIEQSVSHLAA
jgi:hypothetical protein